MEQSIKILLNRMRSVLDGKEPTAVLYGSAVLDDFRLGWSDIDLLCLTQLRLNDAQAQTIVGLRQALQREFPENPYFRAFEGHICHRDALSQGGCVVYWGTSGQRIKSRCDLDPFSRLEIADFGRILCGEDLRSWIRRPSGQELHEAVRTHCQTIREHGSETGQSLYSAGWILDIARCLYTLQTGSILGKTQAGEWALKNGCAGDEDVMRRVLKIRRHPLRAREDPQTMAWLGTLGTKIQEYADLLEERLCNLQ